MNLEKKYWLSFMFNQKNEKRKSKENMCITNTFLFICNRFMYVNLSMVQGIVANEQINICQCSLSFLCAFKIEYTFLLMCENDSKQTKNGI